MNSKINSKKEFSFENINYYTKNGGNMNFQMLLEEAQSDIDELVKHRRFLHENAEVGFELTKTFKYVFDELKNYGYSPQKCGKCGIVAEIGKGNDCFLLRADMDALPIAEESGLDFAARNGNMHACGHDMHTAMLLGAAKILKAHQNELDASVKLMFQPAEETLEGAKDMIENGVLQSPDVSSAMMIHTASSISLPTRCVIVPSAGIGAPSCDHFKIEVSGKGCHGSTPHLGVDAILTSAHILIGMSEIISHEISPTDQAVLTFGRFEGGDVGNAIADKAILSGTLRTFDEDKRAFIKERMENITQNLAKAYRANARLIFERGCPGFMNSEKAVARANACAVGLLGKEKVISASDLAGSEHGGSEDFAYISHRVPTVVLSLCAGEKKKGYEYPLHHPKVRFDESALPVGAALYACFTLSL